MTEILEKVFVAVAVFVFVVAFGLHGLHVYRMPPAQAQTDLGPDTVMESEATL